MNEFQFAIKSAGKGVLAPLFLVFGAVGYGLYTWFTHKDPTQFIYFLTDILPVFSFFWVVLIISEAFTPQGGEIFFVYQNLRSIWVKKTAVLAFSYTVLILSVSTLFLYLFHQLNLWSILKIVFSSLFYGFLSFFLLTLFKDRIWASFLTLSIFLIFEYARMDLFINVQRLFGREYGIGLSLFVHAIYLFIFLVLGSRRLPLKN